MPTAIEQVRTITADRFIYDHAEKIADGARRDFDLPNAPVRAGSATVSLNGAAQTVNVDYAIDEPAGVVTFTATPPAGQLVVVTYQWSILSDVDYQTFLDLNGSGIKLAAAGALDTIASSEALVQKVVRILDVSTDGAAVARAIRDHAAALREEVLQSYEIEAGAFDWAEQVVDQTTYWELLGKQAEAQS